jgi:hypothetical protein
MRGRSIVPALLAGALPLALILDVLRPLVLERSLLDQLAREWGIDDDLARLHSSDWALLAGGAALLAWVAVLAWRGRRSTLERVALLGLSAGLTFAAFEGCLRWLGRPMVYRPNLRLTLTPDPVILPGTTSPMRFSTNRLGMRAPEWDPQARRILCVGGSTTICLYLDDEKAWPRRLMTLLNAGRPARPVWVGNVGKSGHDTYHHLALLERLREASQVDAVIVLAGVNDLAHSIRASHESRRRTAPSAVFDAGGPFNPSQPYVKQVFAYQALRSMVASTGLGRIDEEDHRGLAYAQRRQRRREATKDFPLPDLGPDLGIFQENLKALAALCRDRGTRCIFMTQPTLWQEPMPPDLEALTWFRPLPRTTRTISSPDLARGMAAFNDAILASCREERVECIDLARLVPRDARHFFDDEHFTERGSDQVAQVVAEYLRIMPLERGEKGRAAGR